MGTREDGRWREWGDGGEWREWAREVWEGGGCSPCWSCQAGRRGGSGERRRSKWELNGRGEKAIERCRERESVRERERETEKKRERGRERERKGGKQSRNPIVYSGGCQRCVSTDPFAAAWLTTPILSIRGYSRICSRAFFSFSLFFFLIPHHICQGGLGSGSCHYYSFLFFLFVAELKDKDSFLIGGVLYFVQASRGLSKGRQAMLLLLLMLLWLSLSRDRKGQVALTILVSSLHLRLCPEPRAPSTPDS